MADSPDGCRGLHACFVAAWDDLHVLNRDAHTGWSCVMALHSAGALFKSEGC